MNSLTTALPDWNSSDAAALKDFLGTDVAKKAFAHVADACPELLDGEDVNRTLVRSGVVKGFGLAINTLFELCIRQPELTAAPTNYPDIDDESAWKKPTTTKD